MTDRSTHLLGVLRIGHETLTRGAGLSLREALSRTDYRNSRDSFGPADLRHLLRANGGLSEEWIAYSEDKRTNGGWYLLRSGEIGRVSDPGSRMRFESLDEAVAEYVVRELDFWAGLQQSG